MKMNKRRVFSPEFKLEAVALIESQGYSVRQASEALSVGESALRRWVQQYRQEQQGSTPKAKALTPEHQQIQQLKTQVKQLELEKEVLKKAAALMAEAPFSRIR